MEENAHYSEHDMASSITQLMLVTIRLDWNRKSLSFMESRGNVIDTAGSNSLSCVIEL